MSFIVFIFNGKQKRNILSKHLSSTEEKKRKLQRKKINEKTIKTIISTAKKRWSYFMKNVFDCNNKPLSV